MDRKKKIVIVLLVCVLAITGTVVTGLLIRRKSTPLICLDAGHGGKDTGAIAGERLEKDDNLRMTLAVGEILKEKGYRVIYTRKKDEFVSLEERYTYSNKKKATVFVAIHRNSAENTEANGIEAWVKSTEPKPDMKLAKNLLKQLDKVGFGEDRGISVGYRGDPTKDYAVNAHTNCKSCLLELGFLSNEADNERFDQNFDAYAKAVAKGIMLSL